MARSPGKYMSAPVSLIAIGFGVVILAFVFLRHLVLDLNEIGASRFGEKVIQLGNGSRIYIKRETRGLNYDVVAVSKNQNVCVSADPETDLVFKYDVSPLAISQSEDMLLIFWAGGVNQPKHPLSGVVVKNVRPDSLSAEDIASMKVQQIDVPLEFEKTGSSDCKKK